MQAQEVIRLARNSGFELAGVAPVLPLQEHEWYSRWVRAGMAGEMRYLTDRRALMRSDVRSLLPSAKSVICVGKLYHAPQPQSAGLRKPEPACVSRYARGRDYHEVLRCSLERLAACLPPCEWKICVDTAPVLERALARRAGLGWIGKNSCLIHEGAGSWFFLGELITSLDLEPGTPPPARCGTCTRCIDACPTHAIVPSGRTEPAWSVDSRLCISYLTIELRGSIPEPLRGGMGPRIFGCDICQEVCPWNARAPRTADPAFAPRGPAPSLDRLAALTEEQFRRLYRGTAVRRARYTMFLRNVALAMGNAARPRFLALLERLAAHEDPLVREHAAWALARVRRMVG